MKRSTFRILTVSTLLPAALQAQSTEAGMDATAAPRHQWHLGARVGLNLSVDFVTRTPGLAASLPDLGASTFSPRQYADGFVAPDEGGSTDGDTWNWGYDRADQVVANGTGLAFHAYSGSPFADSADVTDDPQWGGELRYSWIAREWAGATWGLDAGLQWTSIAVEDSRARSGSLLETTDVYDLQGILPPSAPYAGSAAGPGPLLNAAAATRTSATVPTSIAGSREFSADLLGLQVGPRLDIPLGDWLSASLGGGLSVAFLDGELRYDERASLPSGLAWSHRGEASDSEWLVGGYLRGQLNVRLSDRWGIYGGAEFQALTSATVGDGTVEARLGLGAGYFFSAGLQFGF